MNPVVSYIFASLESDERALIKVVKILNRQHKINGNLMVGMYVATLMSLYGLYSIGKNKEEISELRKEIEELKTKGD